jgi:FlaA1/EpsC-like NDP-sugar epimerase
MGEPVRIIDLAEKMIKSYGLTPYKDVNIVETGLRPGEKLYEEFLVKAENVKRTANDKIFVENEPLPLRNEVEAVLTELKNALDKDESVLIEALKRAVPEYR